MTLHNSIIIVTGILVVFTLGMVLLSTLYGMDTVRPEYSVVRRGSKECDVVARQFMLQRNSVSAQLNHVKQQVAIKSCEMQELMAKFNNTKNQSTDGVSVNGGWCKEFSGPSSSNHVFDDKLAEALAAFLRGKRVASFGDGPGDYKKYIDNSQKVVLYDAYDGAPYCEETTDGRVKFLDLTAPQFGLPIYDWVLSIEVAEHIPAKYESVYLDNIFRHAQEGIILSWAVPGQGGLSHVNLKSFDEVQRLMLDGGYELDRKPGEMLRNAAKVSWLKQNVYVYRRISKTALSPDNA